MAERSGFFSAIKNAEGNWDRTYRSGDYCDNLAVIISNGVVRSENDDLRVTAAGLAVTVSEGRGWIKGHWYHSDSNVTFPAVTAPTGNARIDRVFLTYDNSISERSIRLTYRQGTAAATPTPPTPTRTDSVYELVLADIYVAPNATSVIVTDKRSNADLCGWVYSTGGDNSFFTSLDNSFNVWFAEKKDEVASVTLEIDYKQFTVLTAETAIVEITIPQYNANENQKMRVYVNGALQNNPTDYSVNGSIITFSNTLISGTEVTVILTVARDGSGLPSIVDDVTDLQNRVTSLESGFMANEYTYQCNGATDNVNISNLVTTFLNGGTDYNELTIRIYGTFGATAPVSGTGASTTPYRWFNAGLGSATNRRVTLDFGGCSQISLPTATTDSYYIVFFGMNVNIKNCSLIANGNGAYIYVFSTVANTVINAENCRFWVNAKNGYIARGGTFTNCRASLSCSEDAAYCFPVLSDGLLRVIGGEYYAYGNMTNGSAVVYVSSAQTNAVAITYGINCPNVSRSGFVQSAAITCLSNNGLCSFTDTITPLTISAAGQNIRGTLAVNKPGLM